MKIRSGWDATWLLLNAIAAAVFLVVSSREWIEPQVKDVPGASGGGPAIFGLLVLDGLAPLLLVNVGWLAFRARIAIAQRDWTPVMLFAGMGAAWIAIVMFSASKV